MGEFLTIVLAFLSAKKKPGASSGEIVNDERRMQELLLQKNSRWFIRLRWLVIACFPVLALGKREILGLNLVSTPMFLWLCLVLILSNIVYCIHHQLIETENRTGLRINIWLQIIVDLLVITVLIQQINWLVLGGIGPLLYLPHLVLACIMLNKRSSFALVLVSCTLYGLCIILTARQGMMGQLPLQTGGSHTSYIIFQIGGVGGLSIAIWFLMSHLAEQIQQRDAELGELHRSVRSTFESSKTQMYHTAHQMKSPVVAIQSILELYKYEHSKDITPDIAAILEKVDLRCESLLESVSDMLFLAKLKSGQTITWNFESLEMKAFTESILSAYSNQMKEREITLKLDFDDFNFIGDRDAMGKMLDNLISNAIRYSHKGGEVHITSKPQGRYFCLQIRDSGIGIKQEQIGRVFEPHYRSTEAKRHCRISTGMGLAIVKEVASFHEINVTVESKLGIGSCFSLLFPRENPFVPETMPLPQRQMAM